MLKKPIFVIVIFSMVFFGLINLQSISLASDGIFLSQDGVNFSGDYIGNLSTMYLEQNGTWGNIADNNASTNFISNNLTIPGFKHEYNIKNVEIWAYNMVNFSGIGTQVIANNFSAQSNLTQSYAFAQEFSVDNLVVMEELLLYFNFTYDVLTYGEYYLEVYLFDEFFDTLLGQDWRYESRDFIDEWIPFWVGGGVLEPGVKYNIVFRVWTHATEYYFRHNFWKTENYTNPSFNKGVTRRHNGISWVPIQDDNVRDMLCYFMYRDAYDPSEVNLKFIIDSQVHTPDYKKTRWGYEAYLTYTFDYETTGYINITLSTNQSIPNLDYDIQMYYYNLIDASGIYNVSSSGIEWTINYEFEEISHGWPPAVFLFERDWTFLKFYDPDMLEMNQIYFGPMEIINDSYYGITNFFGPQLEPGNYTGKFTSPNYCHQISTKVNEGGSFVYKPTFELGQTVKFEAEIMNAFNEHISGGSGQITVKTPSGVIMYQEANLTSDNGIMSSSEIVLTSDLTEGTYEATMFWTNGQEVAYYSIQITVNDPMKIFIIMGIIIGIAAISTPLALVVRKQVRQRNWEKSLKNLFVLNKDGLNVYEYSFGIEIQDPALISAMISALTNFIREATGSKKALRTVDQEDKKVILYHGEVVTAVILGDKDLPIIHKRIKKFTENFELDYGKHLKTWSGDTSVFKGAEVIVNKYFPLDVEDQIIRGVRQKLIEFRETLDFLKDPKSIISLMRQITDFISRYQTIVTTHYLDYYNEIIRIAEEKISAAY